MPSSGWTNVSRLVKLWRATHRLLRAEEFQLWYYFGSLMLVLVMQITGIFLTMNYKPDAKLVRVRRIHHARRCRAAGSSATCIPRRLRVLHRGVPAHVPRIDYGSHKPRELLWVFGCMIYLCLMAEAFLATRFPGGQMSHWGARRSSICSPLSHSSARIWRSDSRRLSNVGDATLNRFFAFPRDLINAGAAGFGWRRT